MSSIDQQLHDKLLSFSQIDKEISRSSAIAKKKNLFANKQNNPSISVYEQEETIHSKLYNDGRRRTIEKEEKISNQNKLYKQKHFNPMISPYAKQINNNSNVFMRLAEKNEVSIHVTESTRNSTCTKCNRRNMNNVNNISINKTKSTQCACYKKCNCKFKYQTHFPFEPLISEKTKKLAQCKGNSKKRILSKKKKYDLSQSVYFSPNRRSPYFFDDSLISQDQDKDISGFIDIYERGISFLKEKEDTLAVKRRKSNGLDENYSFKPNCSLTKKVYGTVNSSKSTNNTLYATNNTNRKVIRNFLNHSKEFENRKQRNLLKLQKTIQAKEQKITTFSPEINYSIKQDDMRSISRQIPLINDYVAVQRNIRQQSIDKEEAELSRSLSKISVSQRKFIVHPSRSMDEKEIKNVRYFRRQNSKDIKEQRKKLHINSFYDDDISISISDRRAKELFVKDFKKAVKNISGYY